MRNRKTTALLVVALLIGAAACTKDPSTSPKYTEAMEAGPMDNLAHQLGTAYKLGTAHQLSTASCAPSTGFLSDGHMTCGWNWDSGAKYHIVTGIEAPAGSGNVVHKIHYYVFGERAQDAFAAADGGYACWENGITQPNGQPWPGEDWHLDNYCKIDVTGDVLLDAGSGFPTCPEVNDGTATIREYSPERHGKATLAGGNLAAQAYARICGEIPDRYLDATELDEWAAAAGVDQVVSEREVYLIDRTYVKRFTFRAPGRQNPANYISANCPTGYKWSRNGGGDPRDPTLGRRSRCTFGG